MIDLNCHWMGRTINLISSTLPDVVELKIKLNTSPIRIWKSSYVSTKTEPELIKKRQKKFAKVSCINLFDSFNRPNFAGWPRRRKSMSWVDDKSQDLAEINAPWPVGWTILMVHPTPKNCVYSPVNPTWTRGLQTFSQILQILKWVMRITAATTAAAKRILCPQ